MPIEYRTTDNNEHFLQYMQSLGKENWIYCGEKGDKLVFYREVPKERKARVIVTGDGFDSFYRLYPLKKSKREAMTMWSRLKENEQTLALDGLRKYIVYWQKKGIEKQFLPHPSTWLHGKRWEDDLSEVPETAIIQTNDKARAEDNEEKKNREEKEALDKRVRQFRENPNRWKEIEQQALSELSEDQKNSSIRDALLKIKIRMIVSKL